MIKNFCVSLHCIPIVLLGICSLPLSADEETYQGTSFGESFELSTARLVRFLEQPPDDVSTNIEFRGEKQFYGQLRYGSEDVNRVVVALDQLADDPEDFALYVDLNRDRQLDTSEKIAGQTRARLFQLETQINRGGEPVKENRLVSFRRSLTSDSFAFQTVGGCQGEFKLGDRSVPVRRIDGDANGLFTDPKDQIWLDLNNDGRWDPIDERFPFQAILKIDEQRYSVHGDQLGHKFHLQHIVGEGSVRVALSLEEEPATIQQLNVTLHGDDGSSFSISGTEPVKLPIGDYMVGGFTVLIAKDTQSKPWYFSFSLSGQDGEGKWHTVKKDNETEIDVFGQLDFHLTGSKTYSLGKSVSVRPVLMTGNGLYITSSGRGPPDRYGDITGNPARIIGKDGSGRVFGNCESGFR